MCGHIIDRLYLKGKSLSLGANILSVIIAVPALRAAFSPEFGY
jgi:hypothetical protein